MANTITASEWSPTISAIAITGASGFIGQALLPVLSAAGHQCLGLSRQPQPGMQRVNYQSRAQLVSLLAGQECLVHLAGVAHNPTAREADYQAGNVQLTAQITKAAKEAGIHQVILISSIKAMGEQTPPGQPFTAEALCRPEDAYGRSKLATEQEFISLCERFQLQWTIIRPPLVYHPSAKGNIERLANAIKAGQWLPFKGADNQRDWVSLAVLNDLILTCIDNPAAHQQIFLASDGQPLSTEAMANRLAADLGLSAKLFKLPRLVRLLMRIIPGLARTEQKLFGNLTLDIRHTTETLAWQPKCSDGDHQASVNPLAK
ncbi:NAD-dependent epimerase/dehydratase family protein [Halioxenophilus sp. WMMB6]|uniref:NAD-dependent epimerase/dehydratase family protein n=1 Tax=Halioxenophilus sp. WMMB6 TaxID=3073815 RepID=UPI00295EC53E|nr:NAD-dependent epimerase/dehydratase family protein [Halioxenophilus sp. WMMB6]